MAVSKTFPAASLDIVEEGIRRLTSYQDRTYARLFLDRLEGLNPEIVREVGRFGLNMLRADQGTLSRVFASKLPEHEKFAGVQHRMEDGVPIIDGTLAWMTCDLEELHPGGDHTIGVGAVRAMMPGDAHGDPLVWYRGDYRGIV